MPDWSMPHLSPAVARTVLSPLFRLTLNMRWSFPTQRRLLELLAPVQQCPPGTVVRPTTLAQRPTERVTVGATERPTAVLYLHGGAYTTASPATHRSLAAHLSASSESVVYVPDYRLAPEHPYPAAVDDAVAAYLELLDTLGVGPESIAVAGDSAGGGLAVATVTRLIAEHGTTPAALGLLSPWTDPAARDLPRERDVVINTRWVYSSADAYLAGGDPTDPGFAPMHADLRGLPPTLVHVGTEEILHPQIVAFTAKLRDAGVDTTFVEYPELWHVAPLQASLVREAADEIAEFGRFLRRHLSVPAA